MSNVNATNSIQAVRDQKHDKKLRYIRRIMRKDLSSRLVPLARKWSQSNDTGSIVLHIQDTHMFRYSYSKSAVKIIGNANGSKANTETYESKLCER